MSSRPDDAASNAMVYVVDDDDSMREAVAMLLRSVGLAVQTFPSAQEFLACEMQDVPSCLILDVRLKGQSGLAVQEQIAASELGLPIVFMTAHGDIAMTVKAMKAGAQDFLAKPFRDQDMLDAVANALALDEKRRTSSRSVATLRACYESLTPRERQVMAFVVATFEAGAHIDIHLSNGAIRQYSLCNSPADRTRYVIAVLKDENGRGGSRAVHEGIRAGDIVKISRPRNHFALAADATKVILIAGGIGVTPLKAMAHELEARGVDFEMHYCARSPSVAAFSDELRAMHAAGRLSYHFDDGLADNQLDLRALLSRPEPGTHVYYCGPASFMSACAEAASHWPKGNVHFEHFKAPEQPRRAPAQTESIEGCEVTIASTGQVFRVAPDQSLCDVLSEGGVDVPTSCCAGLCATCKVRYLEGEVEHNDFILSDEERQEFMTVCVSRPVSKTLVLDL